MKLILAAVGRAKGGPEARLYDRFAGRLRTPLNLIEVDEKRPFEGAERQRREAGLLLRAVPGDAFVAALDEHGRAFSSRDFAGWYRERLESGVGALAFVIGGAGGLHADIKKRADQLIAFGPMTWPHLLVRGMLAEQLYRAEQIAAGHPYHRD